MSATIEQFQLRFARLSRREKLMVAGTLILSLWGVWDSVFYQPLSKQQQSVITEISTVQKQLEAQLQIAKQLENLGRKDVNNDARQQLSQLQQSASSLKAQLSQGGKKFVPAQSMASALRDLLKQHGNLKLIKLETLPASGFGNKADEPIWVYRHAMLITLQGDYFSTLNYLKALETLPWRIHWDSIAYQVKDYPLAETQIQVYTLSFEQDLLGV
jgi:MSHA biogenesis protein MshJ